MVCKGNNIDCSGATHGGHKGAGRIFLALPVDGLLRETTRSSGLLRETTTSPRFGGFTSFERDPSA